ncbi:MAG: hypothetical protein LBF85_10130, partial [Tannerella sp.]|nr:hypothetical protein [Tannerella sp.]
MQKYKKKKNKRACAAKNPARKDSAIPEFSHSVRKPFAGQKKNALRATVPPCLKPSFPLWYRDGDDGAPRPEFAAPV